MSDATSGTTWMIYGANGYTGDLVAKLAKAGGHRPVLAGRSREAVESMARELGMESRVFGLDDPREVARNLEGVAAVLHCAGPFSATSRPMLEGCVLSRTHYLDITGEIDVFEHVHTNDARWRGAGITVIPGVGFDVVPSDCLAAMLARELPSATHLRMAFKSKRGKMSPGTTKTMVEGLARGGMIRREGRLTPVPQAYRVETLPFADGDHLAVTIPWGDVSTAYYSTGIPNIEVYLGTSAEQLRQMKMIRYLGPILGLGPVQSYLKRQVGKKVKGPTPEQREADETQLWGEVTDASRNRVTLRMRTPEGYTLTADSALASTLKILQGNVPAGALTPSKAFGADFVKSLPGVEVYGPDRS
jgi:short subunit dehydrogenase-like uncharacterized protein